MLYSLVDGRARTATELAVIAGVTPATASVHLQRLHAQGLVRVAAQGRHRYYSLGGAHVADALEALSVLAGRSRDRFVPSTPQRLRAARTCYDHLAGTLAVALHDRFVAAKWLSSSTGKDGTYDVTAAGARTLESLGVDVGTARAQRRRFAFGCLDWSERRPHIGGALGAALLTLVLEKKWVARDLDSRAVSLTAVGRRELAARLGVDTMLESEA
jgi:DNA-binding transcriptional ArsR family regulator